MIVLAPNFMTKICKKVAQHFHCTVSKVVKSVALWSANIRKLAKEQVHKGYGSAAMVVSVDTMFTFENRLDKYWANQPMKYDFNSDYITGRDKGIVYEEEEQNILATSQRSESP